MPKTPTIFLPGTSTLGKWLFYLALFVGAVTAGYVGSSAGDVLRSSPFIVRAIVSWLVTIVILLFFALGAGFSVAKWFRNDPNAE